MNNTSVGGIDPRNNEAFAYYETVGGGMGAGPTGPGLSGVHCHMSNSLNTPVEALEHAYPYRVTHYGIRRGSGGSGMYQGGDGLRRDLMLLVPARVALLCERRTIGPSGTQGGNAGAPGENVLISDGVGLGKTFIGGEVLREVAEDKRQRGPPLEGQYITLKGNSRRTAPGGRYVMLP